MADDTENQLTLFVADSPAKTFRTLVDAPGFVATEADYGKNYVPTTPYVRALVLIDRIENHAAAVRWCGSNGVQQNFELIG